MTDPPEIRQRLSKLTAPQRQALLARLGKEKASRPSLDHGVAIPAAQPLRVEPAPTPGDPMATAALYPAGPGQLQIWYHHCLAPESAAYHSPLCFHLLGPLNAKWLESAFHKIIQRHATLRTIFSADDGRLIQRVASSSTFTLEHESLEPTAGEARCALAERRVQEWATRPFRLAVEPPFRAVLLRLASEEHVLAIGLHHIISDGWSRTNLCRELSTLYEAASRDPGPELPTLSRQYSDYAAWQDSLPEPGSLAKQIEYWDARLSGDLEPLNLPTDHRRPAFPCFSGDQLVLPFEPELWQALKSRAQEENSTLFMLLLATFKTLLYGQTGQADLRVGVPVANRLQQETEGLIGLFMNTLVMRTDLSGNPTFRELLVRVRETALGAYANGEVPFEQIVQRVMGRAPGHGLQLVQTLFALQDFPETSLSLPGIQVEAWPVNTRTAKVDLSFAIERSGHGWITKLEYSTELFDRGRMDRFLATWLRILQGVVVHPDQRLSQFNRASGEDCLTPARQSRRPELGERVPVEWNEAHGEYDADQCLHRLIEEQATRAPEESAVCFEGKTLTYGQLNRRANQLAHTLRQLHVKPDTPVGLFAERSPELIIGLVGILKAGGAYLPLDPGYPEERLEFMLQDAQPKALVTTTHLGPRLPKRDIPRVCVDQLPEASGPAWLENPVACVTPSNLAYLIYTSGSTGRPNGVLIEHRSVVNYTLAAIRQFNLRPADRVLQFASISFDASAEEIFPCLASGATLVLRTEEMLARPAAFLARCTDWGVTVLDLPTAYWSHLVSQMELERLTMPPAIRLVIIGGERASPEALATWRQLSGRQVRLINTYGPTEATIVVTWSDLTFETPEPGGQLPIGKPVPNTAAYVLDPNLRAVPSGVAGELLVGGLGLARGYHNRPELTAARFISNPFPNPASPRLYRTGDRVSLRPDGQLEFHGRIDQQVKVRGHRIELGEIEAILARHPDVRSAAVVARYDSAGNTQLAAFLVARKGGKLSTGLLRQWLETQLPKFMVPASFVQLQELPLTSNGKLDRRALEAASGTEPDTESAYCAPRNDVERKLAEIWETVLRRSPIGVQDEFFVLGGHSLLAMAINARITQGFGVEVPLRWVFEQPTIEGLARRIQLLEQQPTEARPVEKADRNLPLSMSFGQEQMWLLHQTLADPAAYNVPFACTISGPVQSERIRAHLQVILARHEVLRTALRQVNGDFIQQVIPASDCALPWQEEDLSALPPDARQAAIQHRLAEEVRRPIDLSMAPLWRILWLKADNHEHVLTVTFHHSIMDEWSMRLFLQEWAHLDAADGNLARAGLTELPVQFADYACWQRRNLTGDRVERLRDFWRAQLRELPSVPPLPADTVRPARLTGRGESQAFEIPVSVASRLKELAQEEETTLFSTLLTAFQVWLCRYGGQSDLVVGVPITRRERPEVQSLIGFFLNTLPVRTTLHEGLSFRETLAQVRETVAGAFVHADFPLQQMVELTPHRASGEQPIFHVMLVVSEESPAALPLKGLDIQRVPIETRTAKNDLTLNIRTGANPWDCRLEYATDLFAAETVTRMGRHFAELLHSIVNAPDQPIEQLSLIPAEECHYLLVECNRTQADYPRHQCVHQLFEGVVAQTPDAPAVTGVDGQLSYQALNARANQLAHCLQRFGVGPEQVVGVCLERSRELPVGVLGILKAGGAYLPLDPTYPQERLAFMLEDSQAPVLLTERRLLSRIPKNQARIVCLDDLEESEETTNPTAPVASHNLAYVIYTSGSTGTPKGVQIVHHNVVNLLCSILRDLQLDSQDVVLSVTTLSFDIATADLFLPLLTGARLVIASREQATDGPRLRSLIEDSGATFLQATPVTWRLLLAAGWEGTPELQMVSTGEALPKDLAEKLIGKGAALWNLYGPTETTIWSTGGQVRSASGPISIGKPLANTQTYVLDKRRQPVPLGVVGELYVGGDGIARGYLNRPELTEEKFLPDPFQPRPGGRLYRTGDLARYRTDGTLECLGRIDHQVKLRGHRIELGEIEATLRKLTWIRESVVVLRDHSVLGKILVAYVVPDSSDAKPVSEIKAALKERLPDYMVPVHFEFLSRLPLTANGKVDRRALPAPSFNSSPSEPNASRPGDVLELELATVWQRVFQREEIGLNDNFFDLGGHSLLAARLSAEIETLLGCKLPMASLFQSPTIAALAARLREANWRPRWTSLVPLQPAGSKAPFFMVHGMGGGIFGFLELAKQLAPDQPFYGLQAVGLDGQTPRQTTIEEMSAHYISELRQLQTSGPYYLGGYSMGGLIAFEVAQQLYRLGERVALLGLLDTYPQSVPWIVHARALVPYFTRRARTHLRRWKQSPTSGTFKQLRRGWKVLTWWINLNRTPSIPTRLQPTMSSEAPQVPGFGDYYAAVAARYRLRRYPGSIDFFLCSDSPRGIFSLWRSLAEGGATLHELPGKHMDIIAQPDSARAVAAYLRTLLERRQQAV